MMGVRGEGLSALMAEAEEEEDAEIPISLSTGEVLTTGAEPDEQYSVSVGGDDEEDTLNGAHIIYL